MNEIFFFSSKKHKVILIFKWYCSRNFFQILYIAEVADEGYKECKSYQGYKGYKGICWHKENEKCKGKGQGEEFQPEKIHCGSPI